MIILRNILGGCFWQFLIFPLLIGLVCGFILWKKRCLMMALIAFAVYMLCEMFFLTDNQIKASLLSMACLFFGYFGIALAIGSVLGGLGKAAMLRLRK